MLKSVIRVPGRGIPSRWPPLVAVIERVGRDVASLSDAEIRKSSLALRYRARSGESLDDLLVEAFALVREAATRRLNQRHYPTQVLGGIAMHFGSIAVMATGEGKTLAAALPTYLASLLGEGAHVATANDYLAQRDAETLRPVFELLGCSVGAVVADSSRMDRHAAYRCDVTYATAKEIGFDFLRDRLWQRRLAHEDPSRLAAMLDQTDLIGETQAVQRDFAFLLVDEADCILIDEARTPLIVSAIPNRAAKIQAELFRWSARNVAAFDRPDLVRVNEGARPPSLNETGRRRLRQMPLVDAIAAAPLTDLYHHIEQAIHVARTYQRDRHYVVRDGKIVIVDEFTGRLAEGRQWRTGLHQAIEARENLEISVSTGEAARVTIQDLCLRYRRLCGMTGTVATSAAELRKIYRLRSIEIPTHRPPRRQRWPDVILGSESQKWSAVVAEIRAVHDQGRPVLVGTRSIDKSEQLSTLLTATHLPHVVLNARHLGHEAEIVARAGQVAQITVATNMAGRGTDIRLSDQTVRLGGLHVICTELHDAARIDRQLVGRCGRQGDPGTYRQFMSLDDDILESGFGAAKAQRLKRLHREAPRSLARLGRFFYLAQQRVERKHFQARRTLLYHERQRQTLQREMGQDPHLDTPHE
jgi:preprotein translocase subunit SecA